MGRRRGGGGLEIKTKTTETQSKLSFISYHNYANVHRKRTHLRGLSNAINFEANLLEGGLIKDIPSIEDEGGLGHLLVDALIVESLELVPLGEDGDGVGALTRVIGGGRCKYELV